MVMWMRGVNNALLKASRRGNVALLTTTPETQTDVMGEVPTLADIPPDAPLGSRIYLSSEDRVVTQNPDTLAWEDMGSG